MKIFQHVIFWFIILTMLIGSWICIYAYGYVNGSKICKVLNKIDKLEQYFNKLEQYIDKTPNIVEMLRKKFEKVI